MGGLGSGNYWGWRRRKTTVEESLRLAAGDLPRRLFTGAAGSLTWTGRSGAKSSLGYSVVGGDCTATVTLRYRWHDAEDVEVFVVLVTTPTQFGGKRWWFICPLLVNGVACRRRAGKLYLPPGARYFGCRKCHDLTYQSSQEAHHKERLYGRLGFSRDMARLFAKCARPDE